MNKIMCLICSAVRSRMINILNTHLLAMYEKLTDLKVQHESHHLCFICNRRLQQCYQLQQLAVKQKRVDFFEKKNTFHHNPLITLSFSKLLKVTIPCRSDNLMEKKTINVKQEGAEEVKCLLELELEQDNWEYLQEHEIKIENESSDCFDLQPINENYLDIGKNTQLLQSCEFVDIKLEKLYTDNILDNNLPMDGGTKYTCDICPYKCNSESNLNKHLVIHTKSSNKKLYKNKISECTNKTKSYICDICKKSLSTKHILINHIRTHTGEKPYRCNICDKTFCQRTHLIVHKRTHTDDKPYHCDVCDKAFSVSSHLTIHKRTHSGNRPYACDVCNKTFSQSGNLSRHKRSHTGDRPYCCDVCNKTFTQNTSLITHKRIHTGEKPYICDICNKKFSVSSSLIKHKKLHTGDKIYSCNVCDKSFAVKGTLITHKRTHTDNKTHVCDICSKAFFDLSHLLRHKRIHE